LIALIPITAYLAALWVAFHIFDPKEDE